jgi:hypothetical protein
MAIVKGIGSFLPSDKAPFFVDVYVVVHVAVALADTFLPPACAPPLSVTYS